MRSNVLGTAIAVIASILWGGVYATKELISQKASPLVTLGALYLVGGIMVLPVILFLWKDIMLALRSSPGLFLGSASLALLADAAIIWSISMMGGTSAGLIETSYPLWTALFILLFVGTAPDAATLLGGGLIIAGVFTIGMWGGTK